FPSGALAEFGFAGSRGYTREAPQGDQTYEIFPFGKRGNYFVDLTRRSDRQQWISNVYLPAWHAFGSHQLRLRLDGQRSAFDLNTDRHDYLVLREDLSIARHVRFAGNGFSSKAIVSSAEYIQDRWAPVDGLMVESGLRFEWNDMTGGLQLSPRLA